MSRSILLQLARDSIQEVLEAQNTINKEALQAEHPLLKQKIETTLTLYLDDAIRGIYQSDNNRSLLENIIISAKKAAFEDKKFSPISTSEYLFCEVEVTLHTQEGVLSEKDPAILKEEEVTSQLHNPLEYNKQ